MKFYEALETIGILGAFIFGIIMTGFILTGNTYSPAFFWFIPISFDYSNLYIFCSLLIFSVGKLGGIEE